MKDQLELLQELQNLDLERDALYNEKLEITKRVEQNKKFLTKLITDLDLQKEKLDEIKQDEREKKQDLLAVKDALEQRKKRITTVSASKEYHALEREIENHTKTYERLRDETTYLGEQISETEASIREKEEKIVQLRESVAVDNDGSYLEIEKFNKKIETIEEKVKVAREAVGKRTVYQYDFIRSRRPGRAVIGAKDGHCEGCFMTLPPQSFIEIQRGHSLISCPSCQRILYYVPSDDEETLRAERLKSINRAIDEMEDHDHENSSKRRSNDY